MLFFSNIKESVGRKVTRKLKNDLALWGTLHSIDQYLNIKLKNTRFVDQDKYPHMALMNGQERKSSRNYSIPKPFQDQRPKQCEECRSRDLAFLTNSA